eukprot:CAMPEP_0184376814 /NCGR_PEP_ID=MMETSP0007-20130409/1779_1 /TAXON_ID=97485 /ORGANISM="Prymnesium parvum, Strain Texoma1" /LENGTH=152 /DNA_ID=CAMNT_0026720507 /DNA_START=560 /DNA_END=1015 /DNA_ORIENTATION=+
MVLHQFLELVGHESALRSHDDAHVIDEKYRRQPADLQRGRHVRLFLRVDLQHAASPLQPLGDLLQLGSHELARAAPDGHHVDQDRRRAVLDLLLKLSSVHLSDELHEGVRGRVRADRGGRRSDERAGGEGGGIGEEAHEGGQEHGEMISRYR